MAIVYALKNWQLNFKNMDPSPKRDRIAKFCCANHNGTKYVKQYMLEEIVLPSSGTPTSTVLRWREKGVVDRIIVSREQVFHCTDDWHRDMVTWVGKGLGGTALINTTLSHSLLSGTTVRPALLA